jgi:hypothetical protein
MVTTYEGVYVQIHVILTSELVEGEWLSSRPGRFTPRERVPGTHGIVFGAKLKIIKDVLLNMQVFGKCILKEFVHR